MSTAEQLAAKEPDISPWSCWRLRLNDNDAAQKPLEVETSSCGPTGSTCQRCVYSLFSHRISIEVIGATGQTSDRIQPAERKPHIRTVAAVKTPFLLRNRKAERIHEEPISQPINLKKPVLQEKRDVTEAKAHIRISF